MATNTVCEINFRPITAYKGRPCDWESKRWSCNAQQAIRSLALEFDRIDVSDAVVETYHKTGQYTMMGHPKAGEKPTAEMIQVWFRVDDCPICLPSARFDSWIQNIKAVAMTLERQRLVRDYGCVTIKQQFESFAGLPEGGTGIVRSGESLISLAALLINVSRITHITPEELVRDPQVFHDTYKEAAKYAHPDKGGSEEIMSAVNKARAAIRLANGW